MTTLGQARKIALALPEATEQDHHGMASFRVRGKIFATVPDNKHLRVMVDEMEIRAAVAANPDICQELYWGKRLACVVVDLAAAPSSLSKICSPRRGRERLPRSSSTISLTPDSRASPRFGGRIRPATRPTIHRAGDPFSAS